MSLYNETNVRPLMGMRSTEGMASALVKSVLSPFVNRKRGTVPYPNFDGSQVCAQTDPQIFFPDPMAQNQPDPRRVKALCNTCPFKVDCLAYALSTNVTGIWGGTTGIERRHIRQRYRLDAMPMHETYA